MCQKIQIQIRPDGTAQIHPTDCDDGGATCRRLSAPYMELGVVAADVDLGSSHLVTVDCVIQDLDALAVAAQACGLELVRNQTEYRWYGRSVGDYREADAAQRHGLALDGRCAHAIRLPGHPKAYEIGVVAAPAGQPGYRLVWDHFCRGYGLADRVSRHARGQDLELLTQAYAVAAIKNQASRLRQTCTQELQADGSVHLLVTV